MLRRICLVTLITITALALVCTGCKKPPEVVPEPEPEQQEVVPEPEPVPTEVPAEPFPSEPVTTEDVQPAKPSIAELNARGVLQTVFFEYDSSDLSDTSRHIIQANAAWLQENGPYNVVLEGHCDERGTIEYNLALGGRRAGAIRDYLVSLGIPASSVRIVSYGEERPVDSGHDESAWSKNRRGVALIEG